MQSDFLTRLAEIGAEHAMPFLRIEWKIGSTWRITYGEPDDGVNTQWEANTFEETALKVIDEAPKQIPKDKAEQARQDAESEEHWRRALERLKLIKNKHENAP